MSVWKWKARMVTVWGGARIGALGRRAQAEEGAEGARHEDHHHVLWRLGLSIIASPCEFPTATHVFATSSVGQKAKANFCSGLA